MAKHLSNLIPTMNRWAAEIEGVNNLHLKGHGRHRATPSRIDHEPDGPRAA